MQGRLFTGIVNEDAITTRVLLEEGSDVIDSALDGNPDILRGVVLLQLLERVGLRGGGHCSLCKDYNLIGRLLTISFFQHLQSIISRHPPPLQSWRRSSCWEQTRTCRRGKNTTQIFCRL